MLTTSLDLSALRTFIAAVDLGGFGRAARVVHRTPGAVSLQLKALEDRLGQPLFVREGKRQRLTPASDTLLRYARRLLDLNDEALLALRDMAASGEVRLGLPQDLADGWLAQALGRVTRSYPSVRVQLQIGRSAALRRALDAGELDLAIVFGAPGADASQVASLDVHWWAHRDLSLPADAPVPLLVLDAPCMFRDAAITALEQAERTWRIATSSGSVSALWSAAEAGLGVTPRTPLGVPSSVAKADAVFLLPHLAPVGLHLHTLDGASHPIVDYLGALVRDSRAVFEAGSHP